MSSELEALIPDIDLKEYRPAGQMALSAWQRLNLRVNWGFRGRARRVWVTDDARSDKSPLLLDSNVESWHCEKDAQLLVNGVKPGVEILGQFKDLDIKISEQGWSGERVLSWKREALNFEQHVFTAGKYLQSTLAVTRGDGVSPPQIAEHISAVRRRIESLGGRPRKGCVQVLWRYLYSNLLCGVVAAVPALLLAGVVGAATGMEFLFLPVLVAGVIVGGYAFTVWIGRQNRKYANKIWYRLFHEGDHDGTVRRALASIGVELPAVNPST